MRKEIQNKMACICYYYTGKCTWLREKICKCDVITTVFIEAYCQFCIVGYNKILSEKLLNVYSYSKIIKFFIALFFISLFCGMVSIPQHNKYNEALVKKEKDNNNKQNKENGKEENTFEKKFCGNFLSYLLCLVIGFSFLTFISSICYYFEDNINRNRWDNIIMAEFIFFKSIDLSILTFYDFFDNTDIFNTTLFITLEKFVWMLIEALFDAFEANIKTLVIIQIANSGILIFIILLIYIGACIKCCCSNK